MKKVIFFDIRLFVLIIVITISSLFTSFVNAELVNKELVNKGFVNKESVNTGHVNKKCCNISDYVNLALTQSDQIFNAHDSLVYSELDVQSANYTYKTRIIPLASMGAGESINSQSYGVEISKRFEFGTTVSSGVTAGKSYDDNDIETANTNAYVQVSQSLFRGWGRKYNRLPLTVSEYEKIKQDISFQKSKQDIIRTAVKKYYQYQLSLLILENSKRSYERSKHNLEVSKSRQKVGLVSKADVYRAELALLNSENNYKDQMLNSDLMYEDMMDYIGLTIDNQDFQNISSGVKRFIPVLPESFGGDIYKKQLEWSKYEIDRKIADLYLFQTERGLKPDFLLSFNINESRSGDSFTADDIESEFGWSVQLQLRSTLDMFTEKQGYTKQKMEINRLNRYGNTLKRTLNKRIRDAFRQLSVEDRRIAISSNKIKHAEKSYELALMRYERGLIDNLQLVEAENNLYTSELENAKANVAYNISCVELAYALSILDETWISKSLKEYSK